MPPQSFMSREEIAVPRSPTTEMEEMGTNPLLFSPLAAIGDSIRDRLESFEKFLGDGVSLSSREEMGVYEGEGEGFVREAKEERECEEEYMETEDGLGFFLPQPFQDMLDLNFLPYRNGNNGSRSSSGSGNGNGNVMNVNNSCPNLSCFVETKEYSEGVSASKSIVTSSGKDGTGVSGTPDSKVTAKTSTSDHRNSTASNCSGSVSASASTVRVRKRYRAKLAIRRPRRRGRKGGFGFGPVADGGGGVPTALEVHAHTHTHTHCDVADANEIFTAEGLKAMDIKVGVDLSSKEGQSISYSGKNGLLRSPSRLRRMSVSLRKKMGLRKKSKRNGTPIQASLSLPRSLDGEGFEEDDETTYLLGRTTQSTVEESLPSSVEDDETSRITSTSSSVVTSKETKAILRNVEESKKRLEGLEAEAEELRRKLADCMALIETEQSVLDKYQKELSNANANLSVHVGDLDIKIKIRSLSDPFPILDAPLTTTVDEDENEDPHYKKDDIKFGPFQRSRSRTDVTDMDSIDMETIGECPSEVTTSTCRSDAFLRIDDLDPEGISGLDLDRHGTAKYPLDGPHLHDILDRLVNLGMRCCSDDGFVTWKPVDQKSGEVRLWHGHGYRLTRPDLPIVRARCTIHASPSQLLELLLDSNRVREYNPMSMGRHDVHVFDGSNTKIVRSLTKPPLVRKPFELLSLLHWRNTHNGHYVLVTRGVVLADKESGGDASGSGGGEVLLGFNWLRPGVEGSQTCDFLSITQAFSPLVPMMLARRLGLNAASGFLRDLQALYPRNSTSNTTTASTTPSKKA